MPAGVKRAIADQRAIRRPARIGVLLIRFGQLRQVGAVRLNRVDVKAALLPHLKGDPPAISGGYYRFKKQTKAWTWDAPEVAGGPANSMPVHSNNIPDAAIINPSDYYVKFEINTQKPYNKSRIILNVGQSLPAGATDQSLAQDNNAYIWQPPFDTKGQWQTVTIPYEDMVAKFTVKPVVSPSGYWTRILIFGGDDFDADISFDNLRIVPKK